jgi:hypothetical protein
MFLCLPVCLHIYSSIHLPIFFSDNFRSQRYKAARNELRLPALTRPLVFPGQHCKVPVARALQPTQVKYGRSESEADFPRDRLTILWCNLQGSVCDEATNDEGNSHIGSEFPPVSPPLSLGVLFDPEDGRDTFVRNVGLSSNYTALQPIRPFDCVCL